MKLNVTDDDLLDAVSLRRGDDDSIVFQIAYPVSLVILMMLCVFASGFLVTLLVVLVY